MSVSHHEGGVSWYRLSWEWSVTEWSVMGYSMMNTDCHGSGLL